MANQSLISVPPDVTEPVVLRRFLASLVEQIDIVLGNRSGATSAYVSQKELLDRAAELTTNLEEASVNLQGLIDKLGDLSEEAILEIIERITAVEAKDVQQDSRLDGMDTLNTTQNGRLDDMDTLNTAQDGRLTTLEGAGYITDAPSDGNNYGRKDGAWEIIV